MTGPAVMRTILMPSSTNAAEAQQFRPRFKQVQPVKKTALHRSATELLPVLRIISA